MTEAPTKEATRQATRIDGKAEAERLRLRIGGEAARLLALHGAAPGLAVVLVGEDPASQVYVRNKGIATRAAGLVSVEHRLPVSASQADVLALVATLNADPAIDGILVQLPLPQQISAKAVIEAIDPAKDVDGFHPVNTGRLWTDGGGLVPCTPQGCMLLLAGVRERLAGLNALVVGRSSIVGKPMAALLLAADCTVTVAHSRSRDLPALARQADILVAAVGRPAMIRGDWIRPGATVIDVGVNRIDAGQGKTRLVGDVAYDEAVPVAGAITPVPGGVGPMTIACLLRNTMIAAGRRRGWGELDL
ncbi:methenyltetrahydrofolate cyclohydrolase /5,10-methylenetetrahydrofolate dehydrogenase (NADP+) [Stella humosa]|uniref:Bifunctional protein FolD n=1 Tax=Stella humosa TaxID=94 RepID=A0A3N1KXQ8_9PROT|nr:bifunctional methylenetetrahydrofolate dehydrogenase/methenyltetrahydrofolate cyclohydrolase FolD [Stella humosa]ROP84037.1 methenyltetrahydrofolate cyclohydrolase /5,10-methylenetetrahydrofolate dehydrogenase (NADP+) [Stella humosa]BBK33548.1 bifunctional protein FolD [Stella humosa]